jgi:hypothetical protein
MMSRKKAGETVNFIFNILENPEDVSRSGMGDIHAALAPDLKKWVTACEGTRDILLVSPVGSVNYDLLNETSDLDIKAIYMPNITDYYHGSFPQFNFVTDAFDCQLSAAHKFVQFILKGSMNHFEALYAPECRALPSFIYIMHRYLQPMVEMNVISTVRAAWFMGLKAHDDAVKNAWKPKKAANALRILLFLITYLDEGKFVFIPTGPIRDAIMRLKSGEMGHDEYYNLFIALYETARGMAFDPYNDRSDYTFSKDVIARDHSNTPEWQDLNKGMEADMIKLIER